MTTTINASTSAGLISSADTSGILQLQTANTAALTIDASQNVGIGTSSPSAKLGVTGATGTSSTAIITNTTATSTTTFANPILKLISGGSGADSSIQFTDAITANGYISWKNSTLNFSTNSGINHMMLNSSGNLGLGSTPSPSAGVKSINIYGQGYIWGDGVIYQYNSGITNNAYVNGNGTFAAISSRPASILELNENTFIFKQASTGTAGSTLSTTSAMTLDASGNLVLGTTSPLSAASGRTDLTINGSSTAIVSLGIGAVRQGYLYAANPGVLLVSENGTLALQTSTAQAVTFGTNGSERARIDSSGNLLVGTTTASGKLFSSTSSASQPALRAASTSATYNDNVFAIDVDRNTTNNTFYAISYYNNGAAAHKFRVADSGNVTNTNNSYGAISDVKLKENIVDATPKLASLQNVRIVNYNRIGSEEKELGVIAQELEQVFPALVETHIDRDAEGNDLGTTTKSVKYSVFVPMLIKAIQEQQAIIQQLQADVAALKGTV